MCVRVCVYPCVSMGVHVCEHFNFSFDYFVHISSIDTRRVRIGILSVYTHEVCQSICHNLIVIYLQLELQSMSS